MANRSSLMKTNKKEATPFRTTSGKLVPTSLENLTKISLPQLSNALLLKAGAELRLSLGPGGTMAQIVRSGVVIGTVADLTKINSLPGMLSREAKVMSQQERLAQLKEEISYILLSREETEVLPFTPSVLAACKSEVDKLVPIQKFRRFGETTLASEEQKKFLAHMSAAAETAVGDKIVGICKGSKIDMSETLGNLGISKAIYAKATSGTVPETVDQFLYGQNWAKAGLSLTTREFSNPLVTEPLIKAGFLTDQYVTLIQGLLPWVVGEDVVGAETASIWVPPMEPKERHVDALVKSKVKIDYMSSTDTAGGRARCVSSIVQQVWGLSNLDYEANCELLSSITCEKITGLDLRTRSLPLRLKDEWKAWAAMIPHMLCDEVAKLLSHRYGLVFGEHGKPKEDDPPKAEKPKTGTEKPVNKGKAEAKPVTPGGTKPADKELVEPAPVVAPNEIGAKADPKKDPTRDEIFAFIAKQTGPSSVRLKRVQTALSRIPIDIKKEIDALDWSDQAKQELTTFLTGFSTTEILKAAFEVVVGNLTSALADEGESSDEDLVGEEF